MTRRSAQDEPRDVAARVVAARQRLTGELRKPITAPCGSLTQLVPTQAPLQGHSLGSSSAPAGAAARQPGFP
jgi:hypothetical protein